MISSQPPKQLGGSRPTIGLDCRLAGTKHAGIGRYILNLAQRLPLQDPTASYTFFILDQSQRTEIDPENSLPVKWVVTPFQHYSLAEQIQFPIALSQHKVDLLHVPHFNVPLLYLGKLVVTIHDLLWHERKGVEVTTLPKWKYWFKYIMYRLIVTVTVFKATQILVPSQSVKATLEKYYPYAGKKILVTPEGCSSSISQPKTALLRPKQLLYIGSLYPHKNITVVLQALKTLPDFSLVLVGSRDAFVDRTKQQVAALGLNKRVSFAGYLSDEKIARFIAESLAVVQPSLSEGFGLTGLEAMGAGGVVIASDIPIFHEVYEQAAVFFDPSSSVSLVEAIKSLNISHRRKLQAEGSKQVKKFSWDRMTSQTIATYQNMVG